MKHTSMLLWSMTGLLLTTSALTNPALAQSEDCAIAVLYSKDAKKVGTIHFKKSAESIVVSGEVNGLNPSSEHGFHIHQYGDCSAADFTSAGGHFNPHDKPHAGPEAEARHVGDLGNLEADEQGTARYQRSDAKVALSGESSILGRGIIVHEKADDLESQPTGAAGGRIACGVIGYCSAKQ